MKRIAIAFAFALIIVCCFALCITATPICKDGEHSGDWTLKHDGTFTSNAYAYEICSKCNLVLSEENISPIVTPKGFSVFMDSVVQGYAVDASALERYEELTGVEIKYGFVTAATTYATDKPINGDGTAIHEKVLFEDLTDRGSLNLDIKIASISDEHKDSRIVFCTYIVVGEEVIYINNNMTDTTVCGFSYNDIIAYLEKNTTLPSIYKYKKLTASQLGLQYEAYWNSTASTSINAGASNTTADRYIATRLFSPDELPSGSYVVVSRGWKIRPEAFKTNENGALIKNASNARPAEVKAENDTVIYQLDSTWNNGFNYVGFNVTTSDNSFYGETCLYTNEAIDLVFQIYVPYNTTVKNVATDEENETVSITGLQMLSADQLGLSANKYWNCQSNTGLLYSNGTKDYYYATKQFTKEELPVGTVIEIELGWQYRAEYWINDKTVSKRANSSTEYRIVIDESFWANDTTKRAFNISMMIKTELTGNDQDLVTSAFKIYVPSASTLYNK